MSGMACIFAARQFRYLKFLPKHVQNFIFENDLIITSEKISRFSSNTSHLEKKSLNQEWYLSAAVCVERIPTLTPPLTEFQQKMLNHLSQIEYEHSKKSGFELRHEADIEAAEKRKLEGTKLSTGTRTAQDDNDAWVKDRISFVPAARQTKSDNEKNLKSTERKLDAPLHLVVERNLGSCNDSKGTPFFCWDLPTCIRRDGESMRDAAERAIRESCGKDLDVQILGNAPWAYYKTKYPKRIQDKTGKRGEKIFIYKGHYQKGTAQCQKDVTRDLRWFTIDELNILPAEVKDALGEILYCDIPDV